LQVSLEYDQLNATNLCGLELTGRQLQLCEEREYDAMAPKGGGGKKGKAGGGAAPSDMDAHLYLGGGFSRNQICVCPALREWIASELQKEAAVLKERRKAREERRLRGHGVGEDAAGPP